MRIGIIREFMVKHAKADEPIVDAAAEEMKAMLGGHLGATLVESVTAGLGRRSRGREHDDDFDRAIAQITPVLFPELLYRLTPPGSRSSRRSRQRSADGVRARRDQGSGTMRPVDWMMRWAEGLEPDAAEPEPPHCSAARRSGSRTFRFHMAQYLTRRAKDWADRGFTETLVDFPTLNARSKFWGDDQRAAFKNWEELATCATAAARASPRRCSGASCCAA